MNTELLSAGLGALVVGRFQLGFRWLKDGFLGHKPPVPQVEATRLAALRAYASGDVSALQTRVAILDAEALQSLSQITDQDWADLKLMTDKLFADATRDVDFRIRLQDRKDRVARRSGKRVAS
jgi:hypothetical protein